MSEDEPYSLDEIKAIYGNDAESLMEVTDLFLEDAPARLEMLRGAVASGEVEPAAKAAHGLANMLGALRNHTGVSHARETERLLRSNGIEASRATAERLAGDVEETLAAIRAERGEEGY